MLSSKEIVGALGIPCQKPNYIIRFLQTYASQKNISLVAA
jgi:hypothetical protein